MRALSEAAPARSQKSTTVRTTPQVRAFQLAGAALRGVERLSPSLAAQLGARLFFTPVGAVRTLKPREAELATRGRPLVLGGPAGPLRGWSWGEGPRPVLLVHGWAGHALQLSAYVEALRARGRPVVAFDMPGHGRGGHGRSSVFAFAQALGSLQRQLGPFAGVVGHSLGAAAVTVALGREGLEAERAVLLSPMARYDTPTERFRRETGLRPATMDRLRGVAEGWIGVGWDELTPLFLARALRTPALLLHAPEDTEAPVEHGVELARAWDGAALELVPGVGHFRILKDPEVVRRAADFLSGPSAPAR